MCRSRESYAHFASIPFIAVMIVWNRVPVNGLVSPAPFSPFRAAPVSSPFPLYPIFLPVSRGLQDPPLPRDAPTNPQLPSPAPTGPRTQPSTARLLVSLRMMPRDFGRVSEFLRRRVTYESWTLGEKSQKYNVPIRVQKQDSGLLRLSA
jgi:hypothetical protein